MNIKVDFNNQTEFNVSRDFLVGITKKTIKESGFDFLKGKILSISVALVSNEEIKKINKQFRGKDKTTDVLSFGNYTNKDGLQKEENNEISLGEIILAPVVINGAAREDEISFEKELAYIFSHGVLHLLGFDHEEEMFEIQDKITQSV